MSNDLSQSGLCLIAGFAAMSVFMLVCLRIAIAQRKLVVVDTAWGMGFIVIAAVSTAVSWSGDGDPVVAWTLLAMVTLWGGRLAWHLHSRNAGRPEDPRYADLLDRSSGSFGQIAFRRVFLPQGLAMWLVATPIMVGVNTVDPHAWLVTVGVIVWAGGLFFEAVGDAQLAAFKKIPSHEGRLMDRGLWRYTRHPNYFGDACLWWGIWLVAASSWAGIATVIGPAAMTLFLTRVTGKSLNEKGMSASKPGYADYVARTSGFIPMPPKR